MTLNSRQRGTRKRSVVAALGVALLLMLATACGSSSSSSTTAAAAGGTGTSTEAAASGSQTGTAASATETAPSASMLAEARKEGVVSVYSSLGPSQNEAFTTGFQKMYPGITLHVVRPGAGAQIQTRLAAEESAGQHNADVVLLGDDPCPFVGADPSWFQSWTAAGVPGYAQFQQGQHKWMRSCGGSPNYQYPVLGVTEWGIAYNPNLMKTAPSWKDLVAPQYSGKILLSDPRIADAYYSIWYLLLKTYGPSYLQTLAKNSKLVSGGLQGAQEVAAGGADAIIPSHIGVVNSVKNGTSAPIAISNPSPTVGLEVNAVMMAPSRLPHPAATKVFLSYLLGRQANEEFNKGSGVSVYDLTSGYTAPDYAPSIAAKSRINKLLGLS